MIKQVYEQANPVSKTAVATLIQLAAAGYERSEEILKRLGFQKKDYAWSLGGKDRLDKICMVANRESRYVALNNVALSSGCDHILDLPCGYVHRAFDMADRGKAYTGGDLPAVIRSIQPVISEMLSPEQKRLVRFADVDFTNFRSISKALEGSDGPLCICTEGLFVYLNDSEKKTVMDNAWRLLRDRGGCWITVDTETIARHLAVYSAIAGDRALDILKEEMSGFSKDSQIDIESRDSHDQPKDSITVKTLLSGENHAQIERQFHQSGFLVEKIPYTSGSYTLRSYGLLQEDTVEKLKKALSHIHVWKFTVDPDFVPEKAALSQKDFSLRSEISEGVLFFIPAGRLDSLSAPLFLKDWEEKKASGKFHDVEIRCENLQYISSAGLRVLMMIQKALPGKKLVLTDVNQAVGEILTTTGFADVFEIHDSTADPAGRFQRI